MSDRGVWRSDGDLEFVGDSSCDSSSTASLVELDLDPVIDLPGDVHDYLVDADARIDAFFKRHSRAQRMGFFPSDYPLIYGALVALREHDPEPGRFCEWGSGFGVVAGLGSLLGYESYGIEIDPRLIGVSREFLRSHRLDVEILEGSFIPDEYLRTETFSDRDTATIITGPGAIDEVDMPIDDFDLIFAFPWPTEDVMYRDLFARFGADGAIFMTYHAVEEVRAYRKVSANTST